MRGIIGAPAGGRVHWFLEFLPLRFTAEYEIRYDYEYHNYFMIRYRNKRYRSRAVDCYVVVRTSRHCFRCMYYNFTTNYFEYFSAISAKKLADKVLTLFERIKRVESLGK